MKASELRIGNLVYGRNFDGDQIVNTIKFWQLDALTGEDLHFKGIPLTEEWLLKFGLKKNSRGFYLIKGGDYTGIFVDAKENEILIDGGEDVFSITVPYVHTLQNAYFALTGEELTIKE